jgi:hypothetical protein
MGSIKLFNDQELLKYLRRLGERDENILYSKSVEEPSEDGSWKSRYIFLTNKAMYDTVTTFAQPIKLLRVGYQIETSQKTDSIRKTFQNHNRSSFSRDCVALQWR